METNRFRRFSVQLQNTDKSEIQVEFAEYITENVK